MKEDYKQISGIYGLAKRSLTVIAATRTVLELKGDVQKSSAEYLHAKMETCLLIV